MYLVMPISKIDSDTMDSNELEWIAVLLKMASDRFSNDGCTDLIMENTPENWALVVAFHVWNGDQQDTPKRPPLNKQIYFDNFALMSYLAARANAVASDGDEEET